MVSFRPVVALIAALVAGGAARQAPPAGRPPFKVIGYYAEWTNGRYLQSARPRAGPRP